MQHPYRADVDGLRALAVMSVICFHAGIALPGGFVGVDVFFVISGFLITGLIRREQSSGQFSIARFWERRIRRIWPASLVVAAATLVAGWVLLLPDDFRALGGDAVAQLAMVANVRFWLGTDYFAPASETRALLHTWSLAVEEQYYLVFPAVLLACSRVSARWLLRVLACVLVLSFLAGLVALELPGHWPSAGFYLLPFRAWELLMGAVLAMTPLPGKLSPRLRLPLASLGLALIIGCSLAYDRLTPFPGIAAGFPCIGTAMVIAAGSIGPNPASSLIGSAPFRLIGKISYSLYLWHWPILAFARYRQGIDLPPTAALLCVGLTFLASMLCFWLVEEPARRRFPHARLPVVLATALLATSAVGAFAVSIRLSDGFPGRMRDDVREFVRRPDVARQWCLDYRDPSVTAVPIGVESPDAAPCFLLWGDSHGGVISQLWHELARDHGLPGAASLAGARVPLLGSWRPGGIGASPSAQRNLDERMESWLRRHRPLHVVLCARWSAYLSNGKTDLGDDFLIAPIGERSASLEGARRTMSEGIRRLRGLLDEWGGQLWILREVPYQERTPRQRGIDAQSSGSPIDLAGTSRTEHEARVQVFDSIIRDLDDPRIHVVDLAEPFFGEDGRSRVGSGRDSWYFDDDHVSPCGAQQVLAPAIGEVLDRIAASCGGNSERKAEPAPGGR